MFFILSKILAFLASPFNLAILCIIGGIIFARYRKRLLIVGITMIVLFSNPFLFRLTIQTWEDAPQPLPVNDSTCRYVVVLGGMSSHYQPTNRMRFAQSGDRLMQALMVCRQNPTQKLIISGGSANILLAQRPEGAVIKEFLSHGILADSLVLVDSLSRNTHENALRTAQIFDSLKMDKRIALVTSAWHMPRARRCFEKQGFTVLPIGADAMYPYETVTLSDIVVPSAGTLISWDMLAKEWMGLIVYKMKGFI